MTSDVANVTHGMMLGGEEQVATLALADGAVFYGRPFGAVERLAAGRRGEVVFATAMTGYQEICTDPSYRGQMVVLTVPMVGNYGISPADGESRRPWLAALLVRECCEEYSHWCADESLDAYLSRHGIPGVCELDTRALTRHLRDHGTQRGVLRAFPGGAALDTAALVAEARAVRSVSELDVVGEVGLAAEQPWCPRMLRYPELTHTRRGRQRPTARPRVVLIDTGYKENIARCLDERGLEVVLAPHDLDLPRLLSLAPDGVLLANGPGDPESEAGLVALVRALLARGTPLPLLGICLGHQILGLAAGATTSRLPFGHHGANHPVRELRTGRVTITTQNHNFQVDAASVPPASGFRVSHVNLSDGSVEGLEHAALPVFSVQYHPEACPGPEDNRDLFDRFAGMVKGHAAGRRTAERRLASPVAMSRRRRPGRSRKGSEFEQLELVG
jgi:carbamoyl-phosphate synthase small subunit